MLPSASGCQQDRIYPLLLLGTLALHFHFTLCQVTQVVNRVIILIHTDSYTVNAGLRAYTNLHHTDFSGSLHRNTYCSLIILYAVKIYFYQDSGYVSLVRYICRARYLAASLATIWILLLTLHRTVDHQRVHVQ